MSFIPVAAAQIAPTLTGPSVTTLQGIDLGHMIYMFVALAILASGALSIIFIFYGGFSFILSGGDEEKVKNAVHTIRYAIIGLIMTMLSLVIVPVIGRLFGVNFNFLDFATLADSINSLFGQFQAGTAGPAGAAPASAPLENLVQ